MKKHMKYKFSVGDSLRLPKTIKEFIEEFEPAPYSNISEEKINILKESLAKMEWELVSLSNTISGRKAAMRTMCPHTYEPFIIEKKYNAEDLLLDLTHSKRIATYIVICPTCGCHLFETDEYPEDTK